MFFSPVTMKKILLFLILVVNPPDTHSTAGENMCVNKVVVMKEVIEEQRQVIEEQKILIQEQTSLINDQRNLILHSGSQNKTGRTFYRFGQIFKWFGRNLSFNYNNKAEGLNSI